MSGAPPLRSRDFAPLAPRAQMRWSVVDPMVRRIHPESVIEIGVGQGAAGARLAAMTGGRYVAFELDPQSAAVARGRVEPFGGVVHERPLANVDPAPADMVCAFEVLEHLADDGAALAEWARYVVPGGHLLLSVPAGPERFGPIDRMAGHYRRYDRRTLEQRLVEAGMEAMEVTLYGAPLGYALEAVRNRIDGRRLASVEGSPEDLTAASGRTGQFARRSLASAVTTAAVRPFCALQRVWPGGVGLVALGRRPPASPPAAPPPRQG